MYNLKNIFPIFTM